MHKMTGPLIQVKDYRTMLSPPQQEETPLSRNRSFLALTATQFLGAFNDNAFKQLIALIAVDQTLKAGGVSIQALAMAVFTIPFLLFCGVAGNLSDRFSKTRIVLFSKIAEIAVMGIGVAAFYYGSLPALLGVLFLMAAQSTFFAPAKYGILPEMLPESQLPRANGVILMMTFLSIILGAAVAGYLLQTFAHSLHEAAMVLVGLAILGTLTASLMAWVRPAVPELKIGRHPFGDLVPTLRWMLGDPDFRVIVLANSSFWFLGGVIQQLMNRYGRGLMKLDPTQTSMLLVSLAIGIAIGSVLGGLASGRRLNFRISVWGLVLMALGLALLIVAHRALWLTHLSVGILGFGGGMFGLPLQTYVQLRPPAGEKGRVVSAAGFINWIFIFGSAAFFGVTSAVFHDRINWIPGVMLVLVLAMLAYLPRRLAAVEAALRQS